MPTTSEYLLLFRGTQWYKGLSPAEIQKVMSRWRAWYNALQTQGKMKGGLPLMNEGKIISGASGRFVTDGPFAESKEAIGGYFLICVDNLDEAIEIARQCPGLEHGAVVEIRPVAQECAASELVAPKRGNVCERLTPARPLTLNRPLCPKSSKISSDENGVRSSRL